MALLRAKSALAGLTDGSRGSRQASRSCAGHWKQPIRQIADNAGVEGSIVVGKLVDSKDHNQGFDAQTETYVDMIKAGIVDPAKVVRTALRDAGSIAALLITAEAMIADIPERESPKGTGTGAMGSMGY